MTALESATALLALGFCPVPVPPGAKAPGVQGTAAWRVLWQRGDRWHAARPNLPLAEVKNGTGWACLRLRAEDLHHCFATGNVGVNLGEASRGLADVDLDCPEALVLADRFLPPSWTFGRASKPRSHRLYLATGAITHKFEDLVPGETPRTLVELRGTPATNAGKGIGGSQTVFPGSVHPSGEAVEWTADDRDGAELPLVVDAAELTRRVARLAEACLLLRYAGPDALERYLAGGSLPTLPTSALASVEKARQYQHAPREDREQSQRTESSEPIAQGARHPTLVRMAGSMRRAGMGESAIAAALSAENKCRCNPPLADREVAKIARSVARYPAGQAGVRR